MNFGIQKRDSHTCISVLQKKLDSLIAPELKSELIVIVKNGEQNVLLDLSACDDCDSSGMSALLLGNRLCNEANGKFVLCCASRQIREMIELVEFDTYLLIADNMEEAKACFV